MDTLLTWLDAIMTNPFFQTGIVILLTFITRHIVLKRIRQNATFLSEKQRFSMMLIKNVLWMITLLVIAYIWWPQIHTFALSVTAIAVALAIATKELIQCMSGALLRTTNGSFSIGDWIEINQMCGEVVDQTMFSTMIHEVDLKNNRYSYTGKTISLPNSLYLHHPVKNLNFLKQYVYHQFNITVPQPFDPYLIKPLLLERIEHHSQPFIDVASRYNSMLEYRMGLDLPCHTPVIQITTSDLAHIVISITIFCPTKEAFSLEQKLMQDFWQLYQQHKPEDDGNSKP